MSSTNTERLTDIREFVEQSSLNTEDRRNALNIVDCLLFLNTPAGQEKIIQELSDGHWLGTVYQWEITSSQSHVDIDDIFMKFKDMLHERHHHIDEDYLSSNHRPELLAIHFDRDNEEMPVKDIVEAKTEIMTFTFCQAFEDLATDNLKCMFLSKLSEGACIEGRMENATNFSKEIHEYGLPTFEDLIQIVHKEAIETLGKDKEIYIEDIINEIFPKYSHLSCRPNENFCPEGRITPENVANYLMITIGYENQPEHRPKM